MFSSGDVTKTEMTVITIINTGFISRKIQLHYDFGNKPVELTEYTVEVPVQILGQPAVEGMKIKVKVNPEKTTAEPEFYSSVPSEVMIAKDSITAYIPVELLREDIPSEKDTTFRITLVLEANEYFDLGIKESLETEITFSNYLGEPEWWIGLRDYCIGKYHPVKYQKLIEIWGGEVKLDDYFSRMTKLIEACKEMYEYFVEHPEYGMEFPSPIVWPYE